LSLRARGARLFFGSIGLRSGEKRKLLGQRHAVDARERLEPRVGCGWGRKRRGRHGGSLRPGGDTRSRACSSTAAQTVSSSPRSRMFQAMSCSRSPIAVAWGRGSRADAGSAAALTGAASAGALPVPTARSRRVTASSNCAVSAARRRRPFSIRNQRPRAVSITAASIAS
jgi:hypothetical protein